jgi:hypothetical protein
MAMPLPGRLQNSHQNGERVFFIFVAEPILLAVISVGIETPQT